MASNGLWVLGIILYFLFCAFTGKLDQFLVVMSIGGFLWVVIGNVFEAMNKGIVKAKAALPNRTQFINGGGVNSPPTDPKPEIRPMPQKAPEVSVSGGNETPDIAVSSDTRKNTISATKALPKQIEFTGQQGNVIPVLFDGKRWHNVNLGKDGHWGIFGTTGSGKGNILQLIALSVLSLGPKKANLTILDGKGGLDYAFALDIDHAKLYYGSGLEQGCFDVLEEMIQRNKVLMAARKRNINEYNKSNPDNQIPLQVVIADELLSFSEKGKEQLELFASQCRAMGGVLIVATQYPTTDVIPSQVQANVTNRIVGRLVSSEHSRVALRRIKADICVYEPAMIPTEYPGIMVLRQDSGSEVLGRSPELTETFVSSWINDLVSNYPCLSPKPEIVSQSVTGVSLMGPLTEEEMIQVNDWDSEEVSRREMARRIYKQRGGTGNYDGSGPLFQILKQYLDT